MKSVTGVFEIEISVTNTKGEVLGEEFENPEDPEVLGEEFTQTGDTRPIVMWFMFLMVLWQQSPRQSPTYTSPWT